MNGAGGAVPCFGLLQFRSPARGRCPSWPIDRRSRRRVRRWSRSAERGTGSRKPLRELRQLPRMGLRRFESASYHGAFEWFVRRTSSGLSPSLKLRRTSRPASHQSGEEVSPFKAERVFQLASIREIRVKGRAWKSASRSLLQANNPPGESGARAGVRKEPSLFESFRHIADWFRSMAKRLGNLAKGLCQLSGDKEGWQMNAAGWQTGPHRCLVALAG